MYLRLTFLCLVLLGLLLNFFKGDFEMGGIRLTWQENNIGEDGHRVYRSTSPMNPSALPAPLATVGPDVLQYEDADVASGTTYYYRVGAYKGSAEAVSSEVSASTPYDVSLLPPLLNDNATFNDEGDSTSGWTASNATLSTSASWLRMTKNTSASINAKMSKPVTLAGTNKDFIVFGKVKAKTGGANEGGVLWLYDGGAKVFGIWLNYKATPTAAVVSGTVSIEGYTTSSQTAVVATGVDLQNVGIEFALQYDHKFSTLNCYFKQTDGSWNLVGRVANTWFSVPTIDFWSFSNAPNGWWVEFDYLTVAKPNIVVIGDSIAEGKTLYSPNRSLNLANYSSTWARYFAAYTTLRNNLVVNKGVGSETSTATLARISDATSIGAKVVFLHASSNDQVNGVSEATRTSNITSMISAIEASGAEAVLLNAMYGTDTMTGNPAHKTYMLNWWNSNKDSVGAFSAIDIMTPIRVTGDFMDSALTQSDKIHPTPSGYQAIGEYLKIQ